MAPSVEDAIARAQDFDGDVMVIGGAQVYALAMPLATHQVLTEVHTAPEGDTHYPDLDRAAVARDRPGAARRLRLRLVGAPPLTPANPPTCRIRTS